MGKMVNMQKLWITALLFFVFQLVQAQDLEGKWADISFLGEVNSAYEFLEDKRVKMYYAETEVPTKEPIHYELTEKDGYYLIEMAFVNMMNGRSEDLVGRLEFISKSAIKMEFWSRGKAPEGLEFTEEAITYQKQ